MSLEELVTIPSKLECGVFGRIQIITHPLGGNLIAWSLQPTFRAEGHYHFFVDFGRAGSDEWETLNKEPIVDDCFFSDPRQHHWDHLVDYYYRVRLLLHSEMNADHACRVFISQPQQANGLWNRRDWLIARDIVRKEYLLQRKRTNMTSIGYLLKRKRFGQRCKRCSEPDTDEVQNAKCAICFGTGFVGGYFPGIDFRVTTGEWDREFKRDPEISNRNDIMKEGRAVAYPYVDTNDVWYRKDNGERYYVNRIKTIAELGNIPIIVSLELRLAPVTDIIYTIPVHGSFLEDGEPHEQLKPEKCDWRKGLHDDRDW